MLVLASCDDIPFILGIMDKESNLDKLAGYSAEQIAIALRNPEMRFWIWKVDAIPQGFVWLSDYNNEGRGPKIEEFAVGTPGQGIGKAMMSAVFAAISADKGRSRCWLKVAADNFSAIKFYQNLGFVAVFTEKAVWKRRKGPVADALTMESTHVLSAGRESESR